MTYIKINNTLYPATISGRIIDQEWNGRSSKTIHLTMNYETITQLFIDDVHWSIVEESINEEEETIQTEYDNSEYCLVGDIISHRDGTFSVKMGKITNEELINIMTGGSF